MLSKLWLTKHFLRENKTLQQDYIHHNWLLETPLAQHLFHSYASELPIIDYHNHLEAKDIWQDSQFENMAEAWLKSDHYVWRAMRSNGIDEHYITGEASDKEKFEKWCEAMPYLLGNPLYQWSHLELKRFFDCDLLLNPSNTEAIWAQCGETLASGRLSTRSILQKLKVKTLCTTDSPLSELSYHQRLANSDFATQVLPTFRADELFQPNPALFEKLTALTGIEIADFKSYLLAISGRIDAFHELGCRLADLGLTKVEFEACDLDSANTLFKRLIKGKALPELESSRLKTRLFTELGRLFHSKSWTLQLHIGVLVNVNQRRKQQLGGGTGFSVINDSLIAENLVKLLDSLDCDRRLPNTVLYCLNPMHNPVLACIAGAFQDSDSAAGKIQFGAAWWFNDHKDGMEAQLTSLKNLGALGRFVGMLTDSRNVLSFSRHEYFRRVLCNLVATWVEQGEIPNDNALLKQTIENICYGNAAHYFNFSE